MRFLKVFVAALVVFAVFGFFGGLGLVYTNLYVAIVFWALVAAAVVTAFISLVLRVEELEEKIKELTKDQQEGGVSGNEDTCG